MAKGADFERLICKQLSLWWSGGTTDAVFWRSSNSGGRATVRGRKGQATVGQHGDIAATNPIGIPFLQLVAVEIKRGYSKDSIHDLLDKLPHQKPQTFEQWHGQVVRSQTEANVPHWLLITRRNSRCALVWMPLRLFQQLKDLGRFPQRPTPFVSLNLEVTGSWDSATHRIAGMSLDAFLSGVTPTTILRLLDQAKE